EEYRLRFEIDINFCLSFLNSCIGHKKIAIILSQAVIDKIDFINYDVWSRGYSFLFLALTYKNLGNLKQSKDLFFRAVDYAEKSEYIQVKAKALTGLAELYRIQSDFEKAINYHQESIRILSLIGAKCDLAEAYYQLALTYQAMNNPESQTHFNKALKLWTEIDAPKQCDRIRNSMNNPPN
ncbi:MAG: tetratricopeptide repeat protein, partial [Cyanobacteria bacterium P01_E01_bin.42]